MNPNVLLLAFLLVAGISPTSFADVVGWEVGQTARDFAAFYLEGGDANAQTATNWYSEAGKADVFVISTCAMWCAPCQLFANESEAIVSEMANEGINVRVYDWIYNDPFANEPSGNFVEAWGEDAWTSDVENVWFGGDILQPSGDGSNGVIDEIYETYSNSAPGRLIVMDRNFVVRSARNYSGGNNALFNRIRVAAVPEPLSASILAAVAVLWVGRRRRVLAARRV